ncbi:MAG: dihydroneopterin aldolase [Ardenticatenaceae bacterium]
MDKLIIRNLELYASIGVSTAEREVGQRLLVNFEVDYDLSTAGSSDEITDTISYSNLARAVEKVGTSLECRLLEYMAEQMCQTILTSFPVTSVRLQLLKKPPPTALMMEAAGIEIYRGRV